MERGKKQQEHLAYFHLCFNWYKFLGPTFYKKNTKLVKSKKYKSLPRLKKGQSLNCL